MSKKPLNDATVIQLRAGAAQDTAITADDTDVLATDLKDDRLEACMSGILVAAVEAADDADGDETYVITLKGRETDSGTYEDLASITVTAGTVGIYAASVDHFRKQLNYGVDVGGTTPSIKFGLVAIATEVEYLPDAGTVITS